MTDRPTDNRIHPRCEPAGVLVRFRETLQAFEMIRPNGSVLIGVSGGPDSMALSLAFISLKTEMNLSLGIAHLNHGLRDREADRDQRFVAEFAHRHRLPFHTRTVDARTFARKEKRSVEDASRILRFEFFRHTAEESGYSTVALGHHRDDNAEQILINLIRGAGISGLSGIPPRRDEPGTGIQIIRPLIRSSKTEILTFLASMHQDFMHDSSNDDPAFLRNRIRGQLIPLLEQAYNPEIRTALNRLGDLVHQEDDWFQSRAAAAFTALDGLILSDRQVSFRLAGYNRLHPAMKRRIARKAVCHIKGDLKRISLGHIDDIIRLAGAGRTDKSLDLPDRVRVFVQKDQLFFKKERVPLRELKRK